MTFLTQTVLAKYSKPKSDDIWGGSKFEEIHNLSSKVKGCFSEEYTRAALEELGILTRNRTSSTHDFMIRNLKVELKFSSAWNNQYSNFKFQQIRKQPYDILICAGMNPDEISFWWCTKEDLEEFVFNNDSFRQHSGKDGGQDLYWITQNENFLQSISSLKDYAHKF